VASSFFELLNAAAVGWSEPPPDVAIEAGYGFVQPPGCVHGERGAGSATGGELEERDSRDEEQGILAQEPRHVGDAAIFAPAVFAPNDGSHSVAGLDPNRSKTAKSAKIEKPAQIPAFEYCSIQAYMCVCTQLVRLAYVAQCIVPLPANN
jgi:hypothetical protein